MKRKRRLITGITLLLAAGFLLTSLASYFVSKSSLRSQIVNQQLPLTGDNIYSEIQRDLLRPIFISSLMAHDTFLRDWVIHGENGIAQITKYLNEIKTKYNAFTAFFVSDRSRRYYYADGILKTVNPSEPRDAWYFRVRQMKQDYEINIDPDMANRDAMTIFINFKVYDYRNRYIGATGVGLTVTAVKKILETYRLKYNRCIYFTDRLGNVMLHASGLERTLTNISVREEFTAVAGQILSQASGTFRIERKNRIIHLNTRQIPEFNWILIVEQSEDAAISGIRQTLLLNLFILAVITTTVLTITRATIGSYQRELERMASTDSLTGLYNRSAFDILLEENIKDATRNGSGFSILLFDLDYFKKINDTFGHLNGDRILVRFSELLQQSIRETDPLCRWGGEEFILLLKGCGIHEALHLSEKLRQKIADSTFHCGMEQIGVTVSIGAAAFKPGESSQQFIARADNALYRAKAGGRNNTVTAE